MLRLGTPYQIGCLGEESGKDNDPIFRLDVTDCTVFILTNVALLNSKNLEQARKVMRFVNYRSGEEISFENRLHFTTDRNDSSSYFNDITEKIASKDRLLSQKIVLNKINKNGKRLIDIDWEKEIVIKYIPNLYINEKLFNNLPDMVGIAFIKEKNFGIGVDVSHEGLLFDKKTFFHASSIEEKVVMIDFFDYYFGKNGNIPKFDGILLFEIKLKKPKIIINN